MRVWILLHMAFGLNIALDRTFILYVRNVPFNALTSFIFIFIDISSFYRRFVFCAYRLPWKDSFCRIEHIVDDLTAESRAEHEPPYFTATLPATKP